MNANETNAGVTRTGPCAWLVSALLVVTVWSASAGRADFLLLLGIFDYQTPFLDSYAVLAAVDAVRAGVDPTPINPFDALNRPHVYSDWWLALRWIGVAREHNVLVAMGWIGIFVVAVYGALRPRRWGEAAWLAVLLVSPAVLLIITRANNDLVIFALLAVCATGAARGGWGLPLAIAALTLATGLKFYPVVGVMIFLWCRPVRRMPAMLLLALLAGGLALASVWSQLERGRFAIGSGMYTMGAPLWWREFGWTDAAASLWGGLLIGAFASILVRMRLTTGLAERDESRVRFFAAAGAIVLLACFLVGMNYAYRWIFLLGPAFWLWRQAADRRLSGKQRGTAAVACGLAALALWQDGIFCAIVNSLPPREQVWIDRKQLLFRWWTQPLHWLLMALLAGWLLEAAQTTLREWWACRLQPQGARK